MGTSHLADENMSASGEHALAYDLAEHVHLLLKKTRPIFAAKLAGKKNHICLRLVSLAAATKVCQPQACQSAPEDRGETALLTSL
jgi:hypothetical protein